MAEENKRKHLEFLQTTINRMAGNLFFLRGWTITIIAALFALYAAGKNHNYISISYFIVTIFWILDGYFLSQERLFRALYNHVRMLNEKDIDFSMDTKEFKKIRHNRWVPSMFSPTLLWFYLSLVVVMSFLLITIK